MMKYRVIAFIVVGLSSFLSIIPGEDALCRNAIMNNDCQEIERILKEEKDLNIGHEDNYIRLFYVLWIGDKDNTPMIKLLLQFGANINKHRFETGATLLCEAAKSGWPETTKLLLQYGADPSESGIVGVFSSKLLGLGLCIYCYLERGIMNWNDWDHCSAKDFESICFPLAIRKSYFRDINCLFTPKECFTYIVKYMELFDIYKKTYDGLVVALWRYYREYPDDDIKSASKAWYTFSTQKNLYLGRAKKLHDVRFLYIASNKRSGEELDNLNKKIK